MPVLEVRVSLLEHAIYAHLHKDLLQRYSRLQGYPRSRSRRSQCTHRLHDV